jgi:hypothetical protein
MLIVASFDGADKRSAAEASAQLAEARRRWNAEAPPGERQRVG